jgi:outer membrane protein OmpA-like peptidoglycan-associated protein
MIGVAAFGCGNPPTMATATVTTATTAVPSAGRTLETPIFPTGLRIGDDCPAPAPATPAPATPAPATPAPATPAPATTVPATSAAAPSAGQALVPLEAGLTLSYVWHPNSSDPNEYECLVQVSAVTAAYVDVTQSCPVDGRTIVGRRRLCTGDLDRGFFYLTETFSALPPVITGTTMFSLSRHSFRELKSDHRTRHRYIEVDLAWRTRAQPLGKDTDGTLSSGRFDHEDYHVLVNDRAVTLPVLSGMAFLNKPRQTVAKILDDERFPLILDYNVPGEGFRVRYTKISYPAPHEMETQLATDRKVQVYGIYFDFARDRLRPESAPVLADIAAALTHNPRWMLTINGHTDNVGGDAFNADLSRRRAAAVRAALIAQYGIAPDRLATAGYGASQPQAPNETPDGRARNRRVELIRP